MSTLGDGNLRWRGAALPFRSKRDEWGRVPEGNRPRKISLVTETVRRYCRTHALAGHRHEQHHHRGRGGGVIKALIQRVSEAAVTVDGKEISRIERGLLILLGVVNEDGERESGKLAKKCAELRIFQDDAGKMNLSIRDVDGEALVVSQFTLAANCTKGRRPSFEKAANPDLGFEFYRLFCEELSSHGIPVKQGKFAAHMHVSLTNDGPVTIMLDTDDL